MTAVSPNDAASLRGAFEASIAEDRFALALHQAEQLWYTAPTMATAGFLKSRIAPVADALGFVAKRVAILRGFTVETSTPLLEVCALLSRFRLDVQLGQYNAYVQELMDSSGVTQGADLVLLALHTRTAAPALWSGSDPSEMQSAIDWLCNTLATSLESFRAASPAPLLLQGLDLPPGDPNDPLVKMRRDHVATANARLRMLVATLPDSYFFDIDALTEKANAKWHDERNWNVAKAPFRTDRAPDLAMLWWQLMRPLLAAPCKVIVTDLDNTLWGGILGEDGADNLLMGPGTGYRGVQEALLALKQRGFLLAVASKNDETAALPVLERHPDCIVRPDDVVAMRIDWSPKAGNIRAMAEELSLGLDSFAFLDDNPIERAQVASELPMVRILPHDMDAARTAHMLSAHPELQRLAVTAEDAARTELYKARRERHAGASNDPALRAAFLESLQQEILVEPLTDDAFKRIADLERKTNQFNLRTRRFSESQLRTFAAGPGSFVVAFRVVDRFGDNGIVGMAVVSHDGTKAAIENFLMSCRVIGRDVELVMLRDIAKRAAHVGCTHLTGSYAPTAKNDVASGFYVNAGFTALANDGDTRTWQMALGEPST